MESFSVVSQKKPGKFLILPQANKKAEVKIATTKDINEAVAYAKKCI
jgi:hypothetical protein